MGESRQHAVIGTEDWVLKVLDYLTKIGRDDIRKSLQINIDAKQIRAPPEAKTFFGATVEKNILIAKNGNPNLALTLLLLLENLSIEEKLRAQYQFLDINNTPLDFNEIEDTLKTLSLRQLESLAAVIDAFAYQQGLHCLNPQIRHVFYKILLQVRRVFPKLKCLSQVTKDRLNGLFNKDDYNYAYIAGIMLFQVIDERNSLCNLEQRPTFTNGPAVLFIIARQPEGSIIVPPVGTNLVASSLQKVGVEVRLIDLTIDNKKEELERVVNSLGTRLRFISFGSSNLVGLQHFACVFEIMDFLKKLNCKRQEANLPPINPKLIGGGMGRSYFNHEFLRKTPIEIIVRRFGFIALTRMLFETENIPGKTNFELFRGIKNICIRNNNGSPGDEREIYETPAVEESPVAIAVEGYSFNPANIPSGEYHRLGIRTDICPTEVINGDGLRIKAQHAMEVSTGVFPFDILHQLGMVVVQSYIGACARGCKGCIYGLWTGSRIPFTAQRVIEQLHEVLRIYPDTRGVGYIDDDFLYKPQELLLQLLAKLSTERITRQLAIYIETAPISFSKKEEMLLRLRDAGIKSLVFGVENYVIRHVLEELGKLPREASGDVFKTFFDIPRKAALLGLSTRVTLITFWPTLNEVELFRTIASYIDLINAGIDIAIFPYFELRLGSPIADIRPAGSQYKSHYFVDNATGKTIKFSLGDKVEPSNPHVRKIARDSLDGTGNIIDAIVNNHGLGRDYHPQVTALAFIKSVLLQWIAA